MKNQHFKHSRRSEVNFVQIIKPPLMTGAGLMLIGAGVYWFVHTSNPNPATAPETNQSSSITVVEAIKPPPPEEKATIPKIDGQLLHQTVVNFHQAHPGRLSVYIYDLAHQEELVSYGEAQYYFPASLYKLYVSFLAWQDIDAQILDPQQILIANHPQYGAMTLVDCLYYAVQISDSICGQALLSLHPYKTATQRLRDLGLSTVSVGGSKITALDMYQLLKIIYDSPALSSESRQLLKQALLETFHDYILSNSFGSKARVYSKAGTWNKGWHDIGIVEVVETNQVLIFVLLSDLQGSYMINLAQQLADIVVITD